MTTPPCNVDPKALTLLVSASDNLLELPTNTENGSTNPVTNALKSQTNTINPSANAPVTSSVLADRYAVGDRSIQLWIKRLIEEGGIDDSKLKENSGNQTTYTAYCIDLLDSLNSHRAEGKKIGQWFSSLPSQIQGQSQEFPYSKSEEDSPASFSPDPLAISTSVQVVPATDELSNLVSAEWQKRESTHQQGIQRIENQFSGRAENRDRLTEFVDAVYGDRVEEIKTKSALKDKLEQVVAADQVIEDLDDDLKTLIQQVVPVKNG